METVADCDFIKRDDGSYDCLVTSLTVTEPRTRVVQFKSDLLNIKKLIIRNKDIQFFPQGLPVLFPNLQLLEISNCKLSTIEANDLKGFKNLKTLNLANNCLTYLPDDLFKHVPQLENAYFNDNNISLKLLEPLRNHQSVDLSGNRVNIVL